MSDKLSFLLKQHMLLDMNFKRTLYEENIEWETLQIFYRTQTKRGRKGWDDEKKSDVLDNDEKCVYAEQQQETR